MTTSVLLDTSFLISLVDGSRLHHRVAVKYYQFLLGRQIPMYFSAIVAAEFGVKQSITDLPLKNFRSIPFNVPHGQVAGVLWNDLNPYESGVSRRVARDDVKLIAQACHEIQPCACLGVAGRHVLRVIYLDASGSRRIYEGAREHAGPPWAQPKDPVPAWHLHHHFPFHGTAPRTHA
jgi:hypothetical protein